MSMNLKMNRLAVVLQDFARPGTCEASLAILKGMTPSEQAQAGANFPKAVKGLSLQYARFAKEAPVASKAAEEAIELGL